MILNTKLLTVSRRSRPAPAPPSSSRMPVVPGRTCGGCDVCCEKLTIDDPQLKKIHGVRCQHAIKGVGCAVYDTRFAICRGFECGWKMLPWIRESLRPDRSGVLVRMMDGPNLTEAEIEVVVMILHPDALQTEGLAETFAAAIHAGRAIYLEVPGQPGEPVGRVRLNEGLAEIVARRDMLGMRRGLQIAYDQAAQVTAEAAGA